MPLVLNSLLFLKTGIEQGITPHITFAAHFKMAPNRDSDGFYEIFGYSVRSEETGRLYESLEDYFEAEPEADKITWQPPTAETLRKALEKMQPGTVYHGVVALAGDVFRQKMFASSWSEPPDRQSDGYAFMQALAGYLALRKEAANLPTELFEERYEEQLETLPPPEIAEDNAGFDDFSGFFSNTRRDLLILIMTPLYRLRHHLFRVKDIEQREWGNAQTK
jgi:hypothetical protein